MTKRHRRFGLAAALAIAAMVGGAGPGFAQGNVLDEAGQAVDPNSLPTPVRLGVRVETVRRNIPISDTVVIVDDLVAYAEAIGAWSIETRWPVLIDDGTDVARENIGRFVRAYEPARVIRWEGSGRAWPDDAEARRAIVSEAVAGAWGAPSFLELPARFGALGFTPPGLVVLSSNDPAWTSGLALAAGHGQIILWVETEETDLSGMLAPELFTTLDERIQESLAATGLDWNRTGDVIDAITLALNLPPKMQGPNGPTAVTDAIGRFDFQLRYAWAGQIVGTEAEAAYRAMCALFLQPDSAWLFNSYEPKEGFAAFALGSAPDFLRQQGLRVTVDDYPAAGLPEWRARAAGGLDAGLVHVNTRGHRRFFELPGGRADAGEIPVLNTPAMVHFVHSFSAQNLADVASIAPRWLGAGAYAYVGSVEEPTLNGFVNPVEFVQRMYAPAPLGASVRVNSPGAWKIAVLGDPLATLGPAATRVETPPRLEGAVDIEEQLARHRAAGRVIPASRILSMLGRDAALIALYRETAGGGEEVPSELADAAFWAFFRAGEKEGVHAAFPQMSRLGRSDQSTLDAAWQAMRPWIDAPTPDNRAVAMLMQCLRKRSYADDAMAIADAARRLYGPQAGRAVIERALENAPNKRDREQLEDASSSY